ncbi:hypothetical protein ABEG18_06335 [Alsobacter sp. KACC 23698]|uniref:Uncharacterized protein n=1 Tax=Alsobacter sp. KACC 23698 TaxID=3149229 RepID=A0AAU7JJL3_9HYPH
MAEALDLRLEAAPEVRGWRPSPMVEGLERPLGLSGAGLVVRRIRLQAGAVTVVAAPAAIWRCDPTRHKLLSLKKAAAAAGERVILVPDTAVRRQPQLATAAMVAANRGEAPSIEGRRRIAAEIEARGGVAPMGDLADLVGETFHPVRALLALLGERFIAVDLGQPISSDTPVALWARRHLLES